VRLAVFPPEGNLLHRILLKISARKVLFIQGDSLEEISESRVDTLLSPNRFVATIAGGQDTRMILNAMLKNNIRPVCLAGTGGPGAANGIIINQLHVRRYSRSTPTSFTAWNFNNRLEDVWNHWDLRPIRACRYR
jgi:hypothetical protein